MYPEEILSTKVNRVGDKPSHGDKVPQEKQTWNPDRIRESVTGVPGG